MKINWPDLKLPPINLYVLPSAEYFYRLRKEKDLESYRGTNYIDNEENEEIKRTIFRLTKNR